MNQCKVALRSFWWSAENRYKPSNNDKKPNVLNPNPLIFGPSPSVISGKKSKIDTGKIIYADRVPAELSYDTNFKWHMLI